MDDELQMPFAGHLGELRKRLIYILIAITLGFSLAYTKAVEIFELLTLPYNRVYFEVFGRTPKLIYTTLTEPFVLYLKVGLVAGAFLASPVIFYQLWAFIAPGLRTQERKHGISFVILASSLFIGGALFGYFVIFPFGFKYLLQIAPSDYFEPMIRAQEYYQSATWMLAVFGLVFELPLIVLYLVFFGLIKAKTLTHYWRAIIIAIFVVAAVLTPPDPASMLLLAIPMMTLYGVTLAGALLLDRRSPKSGEK